MGNTRKMLRREQAVLAAGLVAVIALSWGWLLIGAGMDMTALEMTAMAGMDGWAMQPAEWTLGYIVLMVCMWQVMMTAMMLPSAAPVLALYASMARKRRDQGRPLGQVGTFALGYLGTWGAFSVIATAAQWALEAARLLSPMLETTNVWLGSVLFISAGLWQLTPIKSACLRHCRSPLGFLMSCWRPGAWGAFRMGARHGFYCLGCCWCLMALLFFGGIMNLYWIAGLAVFVLLEKTFSHAHWFGRVTGVALVGWGLALPVM
ncbi:MAG: DUF2182 domain-containing protein [Chromatiales bacterium]|jgi:predicted metal-binding membrane protein|nr:DUF2182 domain-containing protein [Chromatiales bacterium]